MIRTFPKAMKTRIQENPILPSDVERRCSRMQDCVRILSRICQRELLDGDSSTVTGRCPCCRGFLVLRVIFRSVRRLRPAPVCGLRFGECRNFAGKPGWRQVCALREHAPRGPRDPINVKPHRIMTGWIRWLIEARYAQDSGLRSEGPSSSPPR